MKIPGVHLEWHPQVPWDLELMHFHHGSVSHHVGFILELYTKILRLTWNIFLRHRQAVILPCKHVLWT